MKHTRYIPDYFFVSRFFIKILYKNVSRETLYSQMSFRSQKMFHVKQLYIDIDFAESISTYSSSAELAYVTLLAEAVVWTRIRSGSVVVPAV